MCGVIGLLYNAPTSTLGATASELLRTLEYRGYDSTGGAIQGADEAVDLRKGVGAPSVLVESLGIVRMAGQVFCGQVRWATFGAVDATNAQPHVVRCKRYLYGAHNGNVTNSDQLKVWLQDEGHTVLSDNDGEMVVHTIEHLFGLGMDAVVSASGEHAERDPTIRRTVMRQAIARASALRLLGSFAAVICDPVTHTVWAIKRGSSLYVGVGEDRNGHFGLASSDLSSVLKMTRQLIPIVEGEFVEMRPSASGSVQVDAFAIRRDGEDAAAAPLDRRPVRSRLRAADIALMPPYRTFMEQEIATQEATVRDVVRLFHGGSAAARALGEAIHRLPEGKADELATSWDALRDEIQADRLRRSVAALSEDPVVQQLAKVLTTAGLADESHGRGADAFLVEQLAEARTGAERNAVLALDALTERQDATEWLQAADAFVTAAVTAVRAGRSLQVLCCGSSYHAARAGAMFFDAIAGVPLRCTLPGEFRGEMARSMRDGDVIVAVSQSGETKDLIDILNDLQREGLSVARVALVNNVNSTLAQEKAEIVLPLRCGPEIAVPATKSFMNQLAVFYGLALRVAEALDVDAAHLEQAQHRFAALPALLRATVHDTAEGVEEAARLLFLRPSSQILATRMWSVAKEGALKIREVVLNHTEGTEASEFKHGPNTILGRNTLYGPETLSSFLRELSERIGAMGQEANEQGLGSDAVLALARATVESFVHGDGALALPAGAGPIFEQHLQRDALVASLDSDYPLVYVTGPETRDVALTISQVNTHKIRHSTSVLIAEPDPLLRQAFSKPPADNPGYRSVCIELPRTGDTLSVVFSSTIVLQRLALRMSELKAAWLDRAGVRDHGVHPDVPKNVSKSITVD